MPISQNNQLILIKPVVIIISIILTFIITIYSINIIRYTLIFSNINNYILNSLDGGYSSNPLTYIKFIILTFCFFGLGLLVNHYTEKYLPDKPTRRSKRTQRIILQQIF